VGLKLKAAFNPEPPKVLGPPMLSSLARLVYFKLNYLQIQHPEAQNLHIQGKGDPMYGVSE